MIKIINNNTFEAWEFESHDDYQILEQCSTCCGEGEVWKQKTCCKPVSVCCGGCGDHVECPDCNGTGWIDINA